MNSNDITLTHCMPEPGAFADLRALIDWTNPGVDTLAKSMTQSLYWVCAYQHAQLIGCARVVGDGAMYFYVQDVIVHPDYQGTGLGKRLMKDVDVYLTATCPRGATIGLLAAKGKEGFYEQFGFAPRDGETLGLGMCRFV